MLRPGSHALRRLIVVLAVTIACDLAHGPSARCETPLEEAIRSLKEAGAAYAEVRDYTAVLHKQERVDGVMQPPETMRLKFRKPFHVYLKWIDAGHAGREVLYVDGRNGNRLMAHEGGALGFIVLNLDPHGSLALRNSRHPITDTGIGRMLEVVSESMHRALAADELEVSRVSPDTVFGRRTRQIEGRLPADPAKGYYAPRVVMDFDVESKLPIRIAVYDAENRLLEQYGYENLALDVGLTDRDFDPANPDYNF